MSFSDTILEDNPLVRPQSSRSNKIQSVKYSDVNLNFNIAKFKPNFLKILLPESTRAEIR